MTGTVEACKQVYDVEDIQCMLGLGRSKAYDFLDKVYLEQQPFRVIKIGKQYRIPKEPFNQWLLKGDVHF